MDVDISPEAQRLAINLLKASLKLNSHTGHGANLGAGGGEVEDLAVSPAIAKQFTKVAQAFASAIISIPVGVGSKSNPCASIIQRLNQLIEDFGAVPVTEVAAWQAQLLSCKQEGWITEVQYNQAVSEIDHPPGRGGPKQGQPAT